MKLSLVETLAMLENKVDSLSSELSQLKSTLKGRDSLKLTVESLTTELSRVKSSLNNKIKPVIIDIKPAKAIPQLTKEDIIQVINEQPKIKVAPQLNAVDIEKSIKNTVTLTYVNNLYGKNK